MYPVNIILSAICLSMIWGCDPSQPVHQNRTGAVVDGWAVDSSELLNPYGLDESEYIVFENKVKRNEHLSDILLRHNVDYASIHELVKGSSDVFDVKDLQYGKPYKVYCKKDSSKSFRCFIYEKNPIEYVVFDFADSANVYAGKKEVRIEVDSIGGVITSSLYETLQDMDVKPYLAILLSEVFAWQIDFFRIDKGDRFKVIYEQKFVEDEFVGFGNLLAASFTHRDNPFYAIRFTQDEDTDYFDEKGQSLRKAFLKAPLKYSRISSGYSRKRFHPILKRYRAHLGVDYAAPRGTPIYAVGDGKVTHATYSSGNGKYVKIKHNGTYTTGYLHLSKHAKGIKKGVKVKQGQVIGYVGSTGLATGPHLCFRFFRNGAQINPLTVELPPSEPVKREYMEEYMQKQDLMVKALDAIPLDDVNREIF